MDTKVFEHLMALLSAHAQAIAALCAVHRQPDELRTALATIEQKAALNFGQEEQLLYKETLATFRDAIPPP